MFNPPPSRTSKSVVSHRGEHLPQLMLSLSPLQPRVRNTRTPPSHSTSCSIRSTISHHLCCAHKSWVHSSTFNTPPLAAAVISALTREHTENLRVWKTYTHTDKACKKKLLSLVPEVYYCTLKKKYTLYAGVTCLTLLNHLHSEYGRLTSQDIDEIDKQMKSQISGYT